MEVASITTRQGHAPARFAGRSPLLRLQSDDKLVALVRKGNQGAFEVLVSRYQTRLLAFCRHMLSSKEDAEDVLQEVFAAAFNALHADDRTVMVRPWLYRIARNRSLNHLRKTQPIGVDSMDVHLADQGDSTADHAHRREEFRILIGDVRHLPETQKTALLLREMENLSYDQIADAMETTVPAVKSLLVRARVSLAEAAEARQLSCETVRGELGAVSEGLAKLSPPVRRHLRDCERCTAFRSHLKDTNKALAAVFPVGGILLIKKLALAHLGKAAGAGGSGAAAGGAAAGGGAFSGFVSAALGAGATKAAAGLAVGALVTAGAAVEVHQQRRAPRHHTTVQAAVVPEAQPAPLARPVGRAFAPAHHAKTAHHAAGPGGATMPKTVKVVEAKAVAQIAPKPTPVAPAVAPETRPVLQPTPPPTPVKVQTPVVTPPPVTVTDTTTLPTTAPVTTTTTTPTASTPTDPPPNDPTTTAPTDPPPTLPPSGTPTTTTPAPPPDPTGGTATVPLPPPTP